MAIRQVPPSVKDPNLAGFLQELRKAIGKTSDQVTKLISVRSSTGGGGSPDPGTPPDPGPGPGPTPPTPPTPPPTPPKVATVVLSVSPARPTINNPFTLTATVSGDGPTGTVQFLKDGVAMTTDPVPISAGVATVTETIVDKGTYTFVATYSGDTRNLSAVSNTLEVQFVSNWDGKPAAPTSLSASTDDPFQILLKWTNPYIGDYATTEIWGVKQAPPAPTITIDDTDISDVAVKLGEVASTDFILTQVSGVALDSNENWYFWVRNRDTEGLYSDWNSVTGTNGKTGTQPGKYLDILTGSITETHLFSSLGDRIDLIDGLETLDGSVNQRLAAQYDNLSYQISQVAVGSNTFDSKEIWYFADGADSWTGSNVTLSATGGLLTATTTSSGTDGYAVSPVFTGVSGAEYRSVRIRFKKQAGSGFVEKLKFVTTGDVEYTHAPIGSNEPEAPDYSGFSEFEYVLSGNTNWTGNTIKQIKIFISDTASTGLIFDWIAVGRNAPGASAAQVTDLASAQLGYCIDSSGNITSHATQSACEISGSGRKWVGNRPVATAVKQVAIQGAPYCVIDGEYDGTKTTQSACETAGGTWIDPGTAAIEQAFQALQKADGELYAQYTVKIDNNGYVSGFGLASEPVNGVPYSDFMVRADRFSISSPTYPTWIKTISSLTRSGTTATCTTSTAHSYVTGDTVIIRNAADGLWNGTFKITVTNTTQFTFTVDGSATTPAVAATGKTFYLTKVAMPFIVTTTPVTINGIEVPAGVYIDSAYIATATITSAQIRDAAITNAKISGAIQTATWAGPTGPLGWSLNKNDGTVQIKGGFALYDDAGNPIITAGKIAFNQFRRLILASQPAEAFTIAKNGGGTTPATITLIATLQNIVTSGSATVKWYITQGTYDGVTGTTNGVQLGTDVTGVTTSTSLTIDPTKFGTTTSVVGFKATCTFGGVDYEDTFTIPKLQEGSDALFLYLSNENDSLSANADGSLITLSTTSAIKVYKGATEDTGWTITPSILTAGHNASTTPSAPFSAPATLTITPTNASPDRIVVQVTATKTNNPTLVREITVTKQKQGVAGTSGVTLSLNSTGLVRTKKKDGTYNPTTFTVTLNKVGTTANHTWSYAQGAGTLTPAAVTAWNTPQNTTLTITVDTNNSGVAASGQGYWYANAPRAILQVTCAGVTDTLTFIEVEEGSDTLQAVLSNDTHTFTCDANGNVTDSYAGSGTDVTVYEGASLLDYDGTGTAAGTWKVVTNVTAPVNIAPSSPSAQGTTPNRFARYGVHSGVGTGSDSSSITYTITGKTKAGTAFTLTKVQTFSKSKTGAAGASAVVMDLSNEAHTVPTDSAGNNGNFTGCATTAFVYVGASDDSANWTFSVTKTNVTCTETTSSRTQTVTAMSADVGYVDFTATRTGYPTQTARFTVTKAKGGAAGSPATTYQVEPSVSSVGKSATGVYNTATVTFSAYSITGTAARTAYSGRFIIATQATAGGAWTNQYTSSGDQSSYTYTVPASIVAIRASLYLAGGTTTLVDQETVPIVADGSDGKNLQLIASELVRIVAANPSTPTSSTLTVNSVGLTTANITWWVKSSAITNWVQTTEWNGRTSITVNFNGTFNLASGIGAFLLGETWRTFKVICDGYESAVTLTQAGQRGPAIFLVTRSPWTAPSLPADADTAVGGSWARKIGDAVSFSDGNTNALFVTWNGTSWVTAGAQFPAGLFVNGGITADKIAGNAITADKLAVGTVSKNLLHNSGPSRGSQTVAWALGYNSTGLTVTLGAGYDPWRPLDSGSVFVSVSGTPANGTVFDLTSTVKIPVIPLERYEISAYLSLHQCNGVVAVGWYNSAGTSLGESAGSTQTTRLASGDLSNWPRSTGFVTAPSTAAYAIVFCRAYATEEANPYLFATHVYFGAATQNQTIFSPWAPASFQTIIDGSGIRTGSVTADVIKAGAITAEKLDANAITADKIKSGTVAAQDITLNGGSIRSQNYVTSGGTQGWQIDGAGNANFNTVIARTGNIAANAVSYADATFQGTAVVVGATRANLCVVRGDVLTTAQAIVLNGFFAVRGGQTGNFYDSTLTVNLYYRVGSSGSWTKVPADAGGQAFGSFGATVISHAYSLVWKNVSVPAGGYYEFSLGIAAEASKVITVYDRCLSVVVTLR